jgi:hypothetical protein
MIPTVTQSFAALPNPITQDLLFTDATYDIGKSGATRPRDGFFSRNVAVSAKLGVGNTAPGTLVHIGNATKSANAPSDAKVLGLQVCEATANSSQLNVGALFYGEQTAATTNSIQGVGGYIVTSPPSGTVTLAIGVLGTCENGSAGTLTNMRGVQGIIQMSDTGGGTDAACFFASPNGRISGGSGTFTNGYGLKVGSFGAGFSNVYALHCSDSVAGILLTSDNAVKSTTNTWTVSSDRRLKQNIRPFTDGLTLLRQIHPVIYELNGLTHEAQSGRPGVSVIAQDVEPVLSPELRTLMIGRQSIDGEDYYTFNNGPLAYVMHNAILELAAAQEALTRRLTAHESQGT